jgi:general secretion pathway protein L
VTFSSDEKPEAALARLAEHLDLTCDVSAVSLPPSIFSFRNLSLPFSDPRKVRQTLGFELEPISARPMDEMLFDFSVYEKKEGSRIMATLLPKTEISGCLDILGSARLDPDVVTAGWLPVLSWLLRRPASPRQGIFLEVGEERSVIYLFLNRKVALVRALSGAPPAPWASAAEDRAEAGTSDFLSFIAGALADTLHSFVHLHGATINPERIFAAGPGASYQGFIKGLADATGIECEAVDLIRAGAVKTGAGLGEIPEAALLQGAVALALGAGSQEFNFRREEFAKSKDPRGIRRNTVRAIIMLGILSALLLADMWVEYGFLTKKYDALGAALNGLYLKSFPEAKRIVDPLGQMKIALNEASKEAGVEAAASSGLVIDILKDISNRIPAAFEMRITRLLIDRETVRITGRTDTFNTVNDIKGRLEPSELYESVTISSATLDQTGRAVQFEMQLKRARR